VRVNRLGSNGLGQLREAEVEDFDRSLVANDDVAGFEIAMDDAGSMRGCQRVRDLDGVLQRVSDPEPRASDDNSQGRTGHVFHRDEVRPAVLADVVDGDDVGMVQRGGGARFLDESLAAFRARCALGPEQLDGDRPAEARVDGAVDGSHPALAERLDDLVVRDGFGWHYPAGRKHVTAAGRLRPSFSRGAPRSP
jgi:hypothetical protein